ncbi:hypothetical protein ACP70R_032465 [Stipagrostis hirtigluma subsp. patula]
MDMVGGDVGIIPGSGYGYGWTGVWSTAVSRAPRRTGRVAAQVAITMDEYAADSYGRNEAYLATCAGRASRLRAELADNEGDRVSLAIDDDEEVVDDFRGARMRWRKTKKTVPSLRGGNGEAAERRAYHRRHRALVEAAYLPHVIAEGRAVAVRNRQRLLFTNSGGGDVVNGEAWAHVKLEHPSTFATLAMDPATFRNGKDYYASVGKAWKRGYLLFGPPGTGKSTMVAAMANFLDYDVYDLELTAVRGNSELRRLFIDTKGKSIIVIEDIDCSVELTGKRKKQKERNKTSGQT